MNDNLIHIIFLGQWVKNGLASDTSGRIIATLMSEGYIYINTNYGIGSWIQSGFAANWHGISFSDNADYFTSAVFGGGIYTTTCSTLTSYSPTYSPTSSPTIETCQQWQSWSSTNSLSLNYDGLAADESGRYMVAIVNNWGYIYVSSNYGVDWNQYGIDFPGADAPLQAWNSVAISATGQYITASVYAGYIYVSSNYGLNFEKTASIQQWSSIATSSSGQYVYASNYDGFIYYNEDFGVGNWIPTAREIGNHYVIDYMLYVIAFIFIFVFRFFKLERH